ncbi:MAG: MmgE/PrpD family protein [Candidatus Verstraetearchaeota archaeon]|nr:MmgE/PrpD family protein [Candidatus Verstraetearchaeota archaeon]
MKYAEKLADFVSQTEYSDLPESVVEKTKVHILDCIGVSIGAFQLPWAKAAVEIAKDHSGKREATIFVDGSKVSPMAAAFANCTLAHSLEFDDTHISSTCHPGAPIIPSALAVAECIGASGRDLLLSVIIGYEIMLRIGMAIFPSHRDQGFHITSTTGNIGAAAAAAKLLGMDRVSILNALALAADQAASGLFAFISDGSMSKRVHAGRAGMNGILSALLAQKGVTGGANILEGKYGFLRAYAKTFDAGKLSNDLGKNFEIMNCWCKQFPCCGHLQGMIRLALKLQREHSIMPKEIEKIVVYTYKDAIVHNKTTVKTPLDAQESASYAVAAALVNGDAWLREFLEEYRKPSIVNLMERINVEVDERLEEGHGSRIRVQLQNGRHLLATEERALAPGKSMVIEKFRRLAKDVFPEKRVEKLIEVVLRLDQEESVKSLASLVTKGGGGE